MKRIPFTREQHEAVGHELHQIRDRLLVIASSIRGRYGRDSRAGKAADKARGSVDALRATMDRVSAMDLGDAFDVHLYYPGPEVQKSSSAENESK
jgi:hypothetical protein